MTMTESAHPLRPLTDAQCWEAVVNTTIGRLAVINGNRPDIFPVNYLVDDGNIVVRTAEGTKLAAAIATGLVAFEIDHTDAATSTGWSVVIHGEAREPRAVEAVMHAEELDLHPWAGADGKHRYIEIVPTQIIGRAIGEPDS